MECGTALNGRVDKKFCSDQCRTTFNNRQRSAENSYIKEVNSILKKNRRILVQFNPTGKSKVAREKLRLKGFDFNYYTSSYITKDGAHYFYCYEQGYLPIEKEQCLLVIRKDF
jgi:hypothetical protein